MYGYFRSEPRKRFPFYGMLSDSRLKREFWRTFFRGNEQIVRVFSRPVAESAKGWTTVVLDNSAICNAMLWINNCGKITVITSRREDGRGRLHTGGDVFMNSQWTPPFGFYLNLFMVTFVELPLKVMAMPAPQGVTLADLNAQHAPKRFYKAGNTIFGYGSNQDELVSAGFHEEAFNPEEWAEERPALASHLILEGFIDCMVKDHGFYEEKVPRGERYEHTLHDVKVALSLRVPDVKLYRGLVVRSIFVGTYTGSLSYGLIIDADFKTEIDHILSAAEVSTYRGYYVRLKCPRPLCSLNCELERFRGKLLGKLNTTSNTGYIPPCMADVPLSDFVALENARVDCSVPLTLCQLDASPGSIQAYVTKKYGQYTADQIIRDIRVRSGDYTPHYKANVQASRDRLNLIVEMVSGTGGKYQLPTGQWVELSTRPILLKREEPVVS